LLSNGGVNDAIGGATSGTLNLPQTAIGGNGGGGDSFGGSGGNASSILIGTNPYGSANYNLTADATGGIAGGRFSPGEFNPPFGAIATADATTANDGVVTATANAQGGQGGPTGGGIGSSDGGAATAVANATGLGDGSAIATATGGNVPTPFGFGKGGIASAAANLSVSNGGLAFATATGGFSGDMAMEAPRPQTLAQ
jgi:hypothetical protein